MEDKSQSLRESHGTLALDIPFPSSTKQEAATVSFITIGYAKWRRITTYLFAIVSVVVTSQSPRIRRCISITYQYDIAHGVIQLLIVLKSITSAEHNLFSELIIHKNFENTISTCEGANIHNVISLLG